MNVVALEDFKALKKLHDSEVSYKRYLRSLSQAQLEVEVNSLLDDFAHNAPGENFFAKGNLVMKEISYRADSPVQAKIKNLINFTI